MQTTSFEQIKVILHSIGKALKNGLAGVLLTSPNGTKYRLTVADDGTLTATAV